MSQRPVLRHPSAFLPIAMSLAALLLVVAVALTRGTAPQPDEGAAARLWQLLIAGQGPIILFFAITWIRREPRWAVRVLLWQVAAVGVAMAPVFLLHW